MAQFIRIEDRVYNFDLIRAYGLKTEGEEDVFWVRFVLGEMEVRGQHARETFDLFNQVLAPRQIDLPQGADLANPA